MIEGQGCMAVIYGELFYRHKRTILVPDWLITSHVTQITRSDWLITGRLLVNCFTATNEGDFKAARCFPITYSVQAIEIRK